MVQDEVEPPEFPCQSLIAGEAGESLFWIFSQRHILYNVVCAWRELPNEGTSN